MPEPIPLLVLQPPPDVFFLPLAVALLGFETAREVTVMVKLEIVQQSTIRYGDGDK